MASRWDYSRLRSEGLSHEEAQAEMDRRANEAESYKQQAQKEMKQGYKKEPTTTVSTQQTGGRKKDEVDSDLRELERLLELRRQREERATQAQPLLPSEAFPPQQTSTTSNPDALDQEAFQHIMAAKLGAQPVGSETPVPDPKDQLSEKNACRDDEGFAYFIRHGNLYKMGCTDNLLKCFEELKPDEVLNVVRCLNPQDLASEFQGRFDDAKLLQTGYFLLNEQQVQDVHRLMSSLAQF